MTWEKEDDLPPDVINEFEHGNETVILDSTTSMMGQTVHTLVVNQKHAQILSLHARPVTQ